MDLLSFMKKDMQNFIEEMALDPNNLALRNDGYIHSQTQNFSSNVDTPEIRIRTSRESLKLSKEENNLALDEGIVPEDQVANFLPDEDYDKEMEEAITEGEYGKAKSILRHLKEKLQEYPNDSQEKKELKILIQQLYEKYKSSLNDPELQPNVVTGATTNSQEEDDWTDIPLPNFQQKTLKQEEKRTLEQAQQELNRKNIADMHREELAKQEIEQKVLLEKKKLNQKKALAEESEKKIITKINLIKQLAKERKYFEAVSAYESLKSSTLLEDLEDSKRLIILEDIKHLYNSLREKLDAYYQKKILEDSQNSLKKDLLHLETEVLEFIISKKPVEAIVAYKKLLSFFKNKQKEIPEETKSLTKKKIHLFYSKIQLLLKDYEKTKKHNVKKSIDANKHNKYNQNFRAVIKKPLMPQEKNLLHKEEKKLVGMP